MTMGPGYDSDQDRECAKRALVVAGAVCLVVLVFVGGGVWAVLARLVVWSTVGTIALVAVFCGGPWDRLMRLRQSAIPAVTDPAPSAVPPLTESAEEAEIASAFTEQPAYLTDPHHEVPQAPQQPPRIVPDAGDRVLADHAVSAEIAEVGAADIQPGGLDSARGGRADNLQDIKGVGPKLEALLHELGIYHFDQIAKWSEAEIAWMDSNLKGFKGRVSRDDWVVQAAALARGEART